MTRAGIAALLAGGLVAGLALGPGGGWGAETAPPPAAEDHGGAQAAGEHQGARAAAEPALTARQIEADWLGAEALRQASGAPAGGAAAGDGAAWGSAVTPAQDAAGGCDGVKTGGYGFHTADEDQPWWQVDLGQALALDKVLIYNRCDGGMGQRNARLMVLLSADGRTFTRAYQHDGTAFGGQPDGTPLVVALRGAMARYVRLTLPGRSYFHLDEVEVYGQGAARNVALGRPATQSSVSQWSVAHGPGGGAPTPAALTTTVARGLRLAENLRQAGQDVEPEATTLRDLSTRARALAPDAPTDASQALYLEARWAVRRLALRNPLLDFDAILFVKAAPTRFPHMSDQFYGWWSRPGGGVFVLEGFKTAQPRLRCLTADLPLGNFQRPELSYDGKKVLFAYCRYDPRVADLTNKADKANVPEDAFYHVFEMNLDGMGRRQLTRGRYDDFDARYLPSGDIVFLSTRKGQFLQVSQATADATTRADLPDSYVRCGGDNYRPVPVFTLHAMNGDGANLRPLSAFENFEWTPAVANDGRILYTRWDYIDRFNGHFFSLWSTNADGSNPQLVYKNYTVRPQVAIEARPVPNSSKLIFTAAAHHSITGGSLVLFDRARGTETEAPLVRLTPEVPFPETEANVGSYYANPWPLSEEHYLVSWSDRRLPPHARVDNTEQNPVNALGIYLYDAFGNLTLLYRDPAISSGNPIPVRARPRPPAYPSAAAGDEVAERAGGAGGAKDAAPPDGTGPAEGTVLLQDVYQGLPGVPRGTIKALRVVGVPPKVQPQMNQPSIGVSAEDPGKFLLGTVPVEADGSAHFRLPSGIPVFFQAVDADGLAVQTMRSLTYVWPRQTLACLGCHESREAAPTSGAPAPRAARRAPSRLAPGPEGSWPLRFDRLVQPVLDRHCVSCHRPGAADTRAAALDLTAAKAYDSLLNFGGQDLHHLAFEKDRSIVGECPARRSKLLALLRAPAPGAAPGAAVSAHAGVKLDAASLERLAIWMDLYAQRQGHFSAKQEQELRDLRARLAPLLDPGANPQTGDPL